MSTNYGSWDGPEKVRDDEFEDDEDIRDTKPREVRCQVCKGLGTVLVDGYETDCIECEGFGSIEVPGLT